MRNTALSIAVYFALEITGILATVLPAALQTQHRSIEYPTPLVREQQNVLVNGEEEIWLLVWRSAPRPVCEPNDTSLTCPCMGFAYGEGGDLDLVRRRGGIEIDRLHVTPLFEEQLSHAGRVAIVQRWPALDNDAKSADRDDFAAVVSRRPTVQIMHPGDYDHDGAATEFYLQTETLPCGKSAGVVIGVSKINPRLHTFGTASKPRKPLHLQRRTWDALRDASEPIELVTWQCGDHGADTQSAVRLWWTAAGIDGTEREFQCMPGGKLGPLIREGPVSGYSE